MTEQRKLAIATGRGNLGLIQQQSDKTWPEFLAALQKGYTALSVTMAEYAALSNDDRAKLKKKLMFYIGARYSAPERKKTNIVSRSLITLDLDKLPEHEMTAAREAMNALHCAHVFVGSTSDGLNGKRSGRLIVPLARDVEPLEFYALSRKLAAHVGIERVDPVSHNLNQICYVPAHCSDGLPVFEVYETSDFVDPDWLLATYLKGWRDPDKWPRSSAEQHVYSDVKVLGDPRDKPGLIGAFCRKFSIVDAINEFKLPYDEAGEDRYTPHGATAAGGARIYYSPRDPGYAAFIYSDHLHGLGPKQNLNAYDAVRLARFGDQDELCTDDIPVHQRPSYAAMNDFVKNSFPEIATEIDFGRQAEHIAEFEDLGPLAAAAPVPKMVQTPEKLSRWRLIPVSEFTSGPPPEWIIDTVIPRSELAVVYGEPGSGKSFWCMDVALTVARGEPWRELETVKGRVVYVCAESRAGFRSRIDAALHQAGIKAETLDDSFFVIGDTPNLMDSKLMDELIREMRVHGSLALVVIDTLARATAGANENSGEDMGEAMRQCQRIHKATNALVMLVHHSGKDQTKGARGWSGIRAAADTEIEITRSGEHREAAITKQRDGEDGARFGFKLLPGPEEKSCPILQHVAHHSNQERRIGPKTLPQRAVCDALREAGGACAFEELITSATARLPCDTQTKDRRRWDTRRAIEQLSDDKHSFLVIENNSVRFAGPERASADQYNGDTKVSEWLD